LKRRELLYWLLELPVFYCQHELASLSLSSNYQFADDVVHSWVVLAEWTVTPAPREKSILSDARGT
jgi:hypothetical protein